MTKKSLISYERAISNAQIISFIIIISVCSAAGQMPHSPFPTEISFTKSTVISLIFRETHPVVISTHYSYGKYEC